MLDKLFPERIQNHREPSFIQQQQQQKFNKKSNIMRHYK